MPCRKTTAKSLVREALLLAACVTFPAAAWAARPVPVFEVDVAGQSQPALQQAMRAALVRATGRRESATDPVFGGLVADAPKYVQSYDRGPHGELQVRFNAAAVDKAIAALDRSTWDPDRPFTFVVIYPAPGQTDLPADQAGLQQAAAERGLPISIVPLPVADNGGNLLSRTALLEMVHRYGAEQLLIGRPPAPPASTPPAAPGATAPPATGTATLGGAAAPTTSASANGANGAAGAVPLAVPGGGARFPAPLPPSSAPVSEGPDVVSGRSPLSGSPEWQWTLYTDFTTQTWTGPLTAGIDDTANLLAPPAGAAAANVPGETEIEIQGVSSLADYANIEQMLGAVPGVRRANVRQVDGDSVVFDLMVRGGGAAIDRALSSSPSFERVAPAARGSDTSGEPLVYRYRSG